jgi:hypothetical protein
LILRLNGTSSIVGEFVGNLLGLDSCEMMYFRELASRFFFSFESLKPFVAGTEPYTLVFLVAARLCYQIG